MNHGVYTVNGIVSNLNTLFAYPEGISKAIYTTNAIEFLNSVIRKAIKKRKLFSENRKPFPFPFFIFFFRWGVGVGVGPWAASGGGPTPTHFLDV